MISMIEMKLICCQIFKIIVESSLIAHSIGNFILKNINTGHFYKTNMSGDMTSYSLYDIIK